MATGDSPNGIHRMSVTFWLSGSQSWKEHPKGSGLHPSSDGLQPNGDDLHDSFSSGLVMTWSCTSPCYVEISGAMGAAMAGIIRCIAHWDAYVSLYRMGQSGKLSRWGCASW